MSKKSPNSDFDTFSTLFGSFGTFFRHFFDTPGQEAREDLFQTFRGFRDLRVRRLLDMENAIVSKEEGGQTGWTTTKPYVSVGLLGGPECRIPRKCS